MPTPITYRQAPSARPYKDALEKETGRSGVPPCELPSRAALITRLEVQRVELLRAMERVNRARRILERRIASHAVTSERQRPHDQRLLESLDDAQKALATAYPMLEGIAEALHVT